MRANVGPMDRVLRIVVGVALVVLAFVPGLGLAGNPFAQGGAILVGAVLVVTGLVRICPLYAIFGLSTCKVSSR